MAIFTPRFVSQLRDVVITAPAEGEQLTYDVTTGKWKNEPAGGATQAALDAAVAAAPLLTPATSARNVIQPTGAALVPLTIKGFAGQTADLQRWQNSAGVNLLRAGPAANIDDTQLLFEDPVASKAPMAITAARQFVALGVRNPVFSFGYNYAAGSTQHMIGEPIAALVIEGDFFDGTYRLMEYYQEFWDKTRTYNWRPIFIQANRDATSAVQLAHSILFSGNLYRFSIIGAAEPYALQIEPNALTFAGKAGAATGLNIKTASGQIGTLSLGWSTTEAVFWVETFATVAFALRAGGSAGAPVYFYNVGSGKPAVSIGTNVNYTTAGLTVVGHTASSPVIIARALSGVAPNYLFLGQTSASVNTFGVTPTGDLDLMRTDTNPAITATGANRGLRIITNGTGAIEMQPGAAGGQVYIKNANPVVEIIPTTATFTPLVVRGAASQSADLQQWKNSAGTTLANVTSAGRLDLIGPVTIAGADGFPGIMLKRVGGELQMLANDHTSIAFQFGVNGNPTLYFGTTGDTSLFRSSADLLKTNDSFHVGADFRHLGSNVGFFNTAQAAKQTVTGSRGGNAALASLLTALATYGLVTDSSTA